MNSPETTFLTSNLLLVWRRLRRIARSPALMRRRTTVGEIDMSNDRHRSAAPRVFPLHGDHVQLGEPRTARAKMIIGAQGDHRCAREQLGERGWPGDQLRGRAKPRGGRPHD